ncbi:RNA 3'-terminal phosphate cyclase-like protein [Liolophura sinensis]|uniref:RNA 3'-terminal phosphate cyclase-like protein n=1 Tax=Liolophura sinensis TaxID=3198878 RepID=UPI00315990AF
MAADILIYEGCNFFRQRLILATLSGKTVKIKKIRAKDDNPGLRDFEASFIRLLDKVTNGSKIVVSETGTCLLYQPGLLIGGNVDHDCNLKRAIGYYLEALLCLSPFTKEPLHAVLKGITNDQTDPSVDLIKLSMLPVLKRFLGTDEGLELKVSRRGAAPDGGGEVVFTCPCRQKLRPIQLTEPGKVKRIRGIAWATRVSPAIANRIVDSTRSILNKCLPDIYIYTDHHKGSQSGRSPGFGLTLVAETTNGVFLSAESASNPKGSENGVTVPEDLGKNTALLLLQEIYKGGCVDTTGQSMAALFMVLGQQDVSKLLIGQLTPYTIQYLRHIRDFLQVMFKMDVQRKDEEDTQTGGDNLLLTCVGVGYSNISKRIL